MEKNINTSPCDNFLVQNASYIHEIVQDMLNCKLETIRRANTQNIQNILSLFRGDSSFRQRDALIEFLRLMPEYRIDDPDRLYLRLKALKDHLTRTGGVTDLLIWAMYQHQHYQDNHKNQDIPQNLPITLP